MGVKISFPEGAPERKAVERFGKLTVVLERLAARKLPGSHPTTPNEVLLKSLEVG